MLMHYGGTSFLVADVRTTKAAIISSHNSLPRTMLGRLVPEAAPYILPTERIRCSSFPTL